jgi:site-specific DNA-methyltransferase (adenine-specific)
LTRPYWTGDGITLYLGDCREVTAWLAADVLVTDPPYGIGWVRRAGWKNANGGGRGTPSHPGIANDMDTATRDEVLTTWGGKPALIFGDLLKNQPAGAVHVLVYEKSDDAGIRGARGGWRRDLEGIYLLGSWPVGIGGRSSAVRSGGRVAGPRGIGLRNGHPHAKPVDVMETLIAACPPGVIADPFAGSGSTLIAARNQGRKAIGVEINERYCEMAARRLDQGILAPAGEVG